MNDFMARGPGTWDAVRRRISELLRADNPELRDNRALQEHALFRRDRIAMQMPGGGGRLYRFLLIARACDQRPLFRDPETCCRRTGSICRSVTTAGPGRWEFRLSACAGRAAK